jgi:hypothetical protein
MSRVLAIALLFAPALFAAPVPKSLTRKPVAPDVTGTTWKGTNGNGGHYDYTFNADGTFAATLNGRPYSKGTWKQDGTALEWEFNNRYSVYTVTFQADAFEGSAVNVKGKSWAVTLSPLAK